MGNSGEDQMTREFVINVRDLPSEGQDLYIVENDAECSEEYFYDIEAAKTYREGPERIYKMLGFRVVAACKEVFNPYTEGLKPMRGDGEGYAL
jgi:hypothetical protein